MKYQLNIINNSIFVGDYEIRQGNDLEDWDIYKDDRIVNSEDNLEYAIAWIMEHS